MSRIWLHLVNPANLNLLHNFLQQHHQIYPLNTPIQDAWKSDLYILDWPTFNQLQPVIKHYRRQAQSVFLPVLLLAHDTEMVRALEGLSSSVDEVLPMPVKKWEALLRVNTLLRMRKLSVNLKQAYDREHEMADHLQQLNLELIDLNHKLDRMAHQDGLTQVANRFAFDQSLHNEWQRLSREQLPLSLILCDVDYFKAYNDNYGHPAGDKCLQEVAQVLMESVRRPADFVARYGGEEFAILLPNTDLDGAVQITRIIAQNLRNKQIPHTQSSTSDMVTLSYGIASFIPHHQKDSRILIQSADQALYQAKRQGRNQYHVQAYCEPNQWNMVMHSSSHSPELSS
ncbi:MAG: diguanylate cyclase domain-containing protein [Thainema sp.]